MRRRPPASSRAVPCRSHDQTPLVPGPLAWKRIRSPSTAHMKRIECPARMSVITPSPTPRAMVAVRQRGSPPCTGTNQTRSCMPASGLLGARNAI